MKKHFYIIGMCLVIGLVAAGCGAQEASSGKDAITVAKALETAQEKTDYLVSQAKAFYSSKEFQQTIDVAQYILRYLDSDSAVAKDLLSKAKEQLTAAAQGAVDEAKKGFADFGK